MPDATRARPEGSVVLRTFSGHVKARPKPIFDALDARLRASRDVMSHYLADPNAFLIVAQGVWWYRAEYRVVPNEHGSYVEQAIVNVARSGKALGPFIGRKVITGSPAAFQTLVKQLRLELE